MFYTTIFGRSSSIEIRNGVGFDLEFVDSRPVYVQNIYTEDLTTKPFQGTILLLPLLVISLGRVYEEIEQ